MPFQIVRNDITQMQVDAIVTSANPQPIIEPGVDGAVHKAAGSKLLKAREGLGVMYPGSTAWTKAYNLPAKIVIHAVGPFWQDGCHDEATLLKMCYEGALDIAMKKNCKSIAFPMISTGAYGFPKDLALETAISVFTRFLYNVDMEIYLVVFDSAAYRLSEKLFSDVASYIDENYVNQNEMRRICQMPVFAPGAAAPQRYECMPMAKASLEDMLRQQDRGFSETLLEMIDKTGEKDSAVYKRANLSKQHFSKIRNNPDYKPTKATALALAIALRLNVNETQDFIGRAGYALTNSSKFDLIVRYFIEQRNYNIVEINMALYEFDQPLLGN